MSGVGGKAWRRFDDRRRGGRNDVDGLVFCKQEQPMLRSTAFPARLLAATLLFSAPRLGCQVATPPVVVVFTFTNSSIGAKRDFEGISTGIQDLLITDLASSPKVRVVDRSRIADLLQ